MSERRRIYGIDSIVGNGQDFYDENGRYVSGPKGRRFEYRFHEGRK